MEELRDNRPSEIVKIAADGDVILEVGLEGVKLLVHSLFLKAASKPFSVMLGPDWKEGHNIPHLDELLEVSLLKDNAAVLKLICAIIHHQNKNVPQIFTASDVLGIADTADKYDCVDALKFASGNWLQPRENKAANLILAAAACLFKNARAFKEITKVLILNHSGLYHALSCKEVESAMTWRASCKQ